MINFLGKENNTSYYEDNKEQCKENMRVYYHKNKDRAKAYWSTDKGKAIKSRCDKEYRENNKEALKKKAKEYAEENKEALKKKKSQYYYDNKEKFVEYAKKNKVRIRLNKRIASAKRKARKLNQTPEYANHKLIRGIYTYCPEGYQVDHIKPLARGGLHYESNLCYLPAVVNNQKSDSSIEEFGIEKFNESVIYWQDLLGCGDYAVRKPA
tara:strand:+ start:479 stop:1108 length:630 start_codon:yes stop_codon:yes gene_type:complete